MSHKNQITFLTVEEVSDLLRLSVLTVYKYIRERKLSVVEFGGHYRISESSLEEFIRVHEIKKQSEIRKGAGNE